MRAAARTAAGDNIKELDAFANMEEQLNRRANDAAGQRGSKSRADDETRGDTPAEKATSDSPSLGKGAANTGNLAEPNRADSKQPVPDEEPYVDYEDDGGGEGAAGGAKGRARNAIEGILLRGPAAAAAGGTGGTDRSSIHVEKGVIAGGRTQEDRGNESSREEVEAEGRSQTERQGEGGREPLQEAEGTREEEVDEEAERKQVRFQAIALRPHICWMRLKGHSASVLARHSAGSLCQQS